AAGRDRDLDGEAGEVDRSAGEVGDVRLSEGVAEDAFGDLVHLVGGDDLAGDKVRHVRSSLSCKSRGFAQDAEVGVLEYPEGGGESLGVVEAEGDLPVRGGDVVANPHHVNLPLGFPAAGFDADGEAVTEAGVPQEAVAVLVVGVGDSGDGDGVDAEAGLFERLEVADGEGSELAVG